jgi:hypothetical protein
LFPAEVAELLGVSLDASRAQIYMGIGESRVTACFQTVTLEVGDWSYPLYVGFTSGPGVVPILGQHGFFDLLEVRFNRRKETIELIELKK